MHFSSGEVPSVDEVLIEEPDYTASNDVAEVPESIAPNDPTVEENEEWMAQCWEGDLQRMVSTQKEDHFCGRAQEDNTNSKITEHPFRQAIIDTGASGSVAGLKWLARWGGSQFNEWESFARLSTKKFRFGDADAVDSLG